MEPIRSPETSVSNPLTPLNNPEGGRILSSIYVDLHPLDMKSEWSHSLVADAWFIYYYHLQ
jgi:hypothetical protein